MGGAIARSHDRDIVPGTRAAVFARIAKKRGHLRGSGRERDLAFRKFVGELRFLERYVVCVHMTTGLDSLLRAADALAIAVDHIAKLDALQRDFVPRRNGIDDDDGDPIDAKLRAGTQRHPRDRDVVLGMQMDGGILRGRKLFDFKQLHNLPLQNEFVNLFPGVYMQLAVNRMNPKSRASVGQRNICRAIDDDDVRRFNIVKQRPDMNMPVTLRPALLAVDGKAPGIAEQLFGLRDGGYPVCRALSRRHLGERVTAFVVGARQSQPAIRFTRIGIFQKKERRLRRLLFRDLAQAAFASFQRVGFGDVAGATAHVGESRGCGQKGD